MGWYRNVAHGFAGMEGPSIDSTQCSNVFHVICFDVKVYGMRVVVHYRVNGMLRDWVCDYDRLDHVINVCETKGFEIVGVEDL